MKNLSFFYVYIIRKVLKQSKFVHIESQFVKINYMNEQ